MVRLTLDTDAVGCYCQAAVRTLGSALERTQGVVHIILLQFGLGFSFPKLIKDGGVTGKKNTRRGALFFMRYATSCSHVVERVHQIYEFENIGEIFHTIIIMEPWPRRNLLGIEKKKKKKKKKLVPKVLQPDQIMDLEDTLDTLKKQVCTFVQHCCT